MITTLTFKGNCPGHNGPKGLLRMPWPKQKKLRDNYQKEAMSQTRHQHKGAVRVELIRYSCSAIEMDFDNLVSTGKKIIDAIVRSKIILDDHNRIIAERGYAQVKCKTKDQRTVIIITDL